MLDIYPAVKPLIGNLSVPPDKSMTHRAMMLACMAKTPSSIIAPLMAEDCMATVKCLSLLGHSFEFTKTESNTDFLIIRPVSQWQSPTEVLDFGNSGTSARLMLGLLAGYPVSCYMTGDESMQRRPMKRVVDPLTKMGACIFGDNLPLRLVGNSLKGIQYSHNIASAQVKSAILLAGLNAEGEVSVTEPVQSRNHTETMLRSLGVEVKTELSEHFCVVRLGNYRSFDGFEFTVPGDISSAAFWIVAALMVPGSDIVLRGVGINPTRDGILRVLKSIGADVQVTNLVSARPSIHGEPVADIRVRYTENLLPFQIDSHMLPSLIDEIPILSVLATACNGTSLIAGASELKFKESDRLCSIYTNLTAMGARVELTEDGLSIDGKVQLKGAVIRTYSDHRIAMSFIIAALSANSNSKIDDIACVGTSYPKFPFPLNGFL